MHTGSGILNHRKQVRWFAASLTVVALLTTACSGTSSSGSNGDAPAQATTMTTVALLPLEQLVQIGATVAIGVLLDTFVVRASLIPAIAYRLGERTWWPSRPDRP